MLNDQTGTYVILQMQLHHIAYKVYKINNGSLKIFK